MNGWSGCGLTKGMERCVLGAVALIVAASWAAPLWAYTYEVHTGISAEMKHETVETCPGPVTRTTVGILEKVSCSIINFVDKDKRINDSGSEIVDDILGNVYWFTEGGGGSLSPLEGPSTVFTAPNSSVNTTTCLVASVHDSRDMAIDTNIYLQVCFNVVVPAGSTPTFKEDSALGVVGPPDNQVGACTIFYVQILPATVSFKRVTFRENIIYQWDWFPDLTTKNELTAQTPGFSVWPQTVGGTLKPNVTTDTCSSGLYPIDVLDDGSGYQDAEYDWDVALEFHNGTNWTSFCVENHTEDYCALGPMCQTGIESTGSAYGGWQGPWK